jgi:hypothetical protein
MEFPATRAKLTAVGYRFTFEGQCRGCKALIEWWISPAKARIPLEAVTAQSLRAHFESCPNAAEFREKVKKRGEVAKQRELFK